MKLTLIKIEFKKEDCWIGFYWRVINAKTDDGDRPLFIDVWICFLPCIPLHLGFALSPYIPF